MTIVKSVTNISERLSCMCRCLARSVPSSRSGQSICIKVHRTGHVSSSLLIMYYASKRSDSSLITTRVGRKGSGSASTAIQKQPRRHCATSKASKLADEACDWTLQTPRTRRRRSGEDRRRGDRLGLEQAQEQTMRADLEQEQGSTVREVEPTTRGRCRQVHRLHLANKPQTPSRTRSARCHQVNCSTS